MKTKIFKHKLLTTGAILALGIGVSTGAQAVSEAYGLSVLEITNFTSTITTEDGLPLQPGDVLNGPGNQRSNSACNSSETPPDGEGLIAGFETPPPFPVGLDPDVANCSNTVPDRGENDYVPRGKLGNGNDYSNGDAVVTDTNIITGTGAVSTIGEAYTTVNSAADPVRSYNGEGLNVLNTSFTLNRAVQITYSFHAKYQAIADIVEFGPDPVVLPSAVITNTNFQITITNSAGQAVWESSDPGVANGFHLIDNKVVEASPDDPNDVLALDQDLEETTPVLPPGEYELEISMNTRAAVTLKEKIVVAGDHFLCYKSFGHFLREKVKLGDQFEEKNFDVLKPKMFCNPAIKPELDPDTILGNSPHYLSYKIKKSHRELRHERKMAEVTNQFGTLIVETFKPDRLMVPSGKSLDLDNAAAIPAPGLYSNHYKCYKVRATGFQAPPEVLVEDQFTVDVGGKRLRIVRPTRLCTPVDKTRSNGEFTPAILDPIEMPADHLMCYSVTAARGEQLNKRTKVLSSNQFGEEELTLKRELEFCVPSTKELL